MGKTFQSKMLNSDNRKNRKQARNTKMNGTFKKLSKIDNKPPNLKQFKSKMIETLKKKENPKQKTIQNLQKEKVPQIKDFIGQRQFIQEEVEEENNDIPQQRNYQETHKYYREMKKIIETCDIILEVLDARDPMSCRCKKIEQKILSMPDKKIIIVLNKIDLIPAENAFAWQTYLRRSFPVVMFKANLQGQSNNLSSFNLFKKSISESTEMANTLIQSSKAIGAEHLLQLIKQLSKLDGNNRAVTVGLIGYPNVGKSSVINSLKRTKTCDVSSMPGCTKNLKEVKLDSQVKLVDCPGIIFEKDLSRNQLILQNTTKYADNLDQVIGAILERIPQNEIIEHFKIDPFTSVTDFLAKVCRKYGKLAKGGIPELKQGAKLVVEDWNRGELKYFTIPPLQQERQKEKILEQSMLVE